MESRTQSRIEAWLKCRVQPYLPNCVFHFIILRMVVVLVLFSPFYLLNVIFIIVEHAHGKTVRIKSCLDAYTQLLLR